MVGGGRVIRECLIAPMNGKALGTEVGTVTRLAHAFGRHATLVASLPGQGVRWGVLAFCNVILLEPICSTGNRGD